MTSKNIQNQEEDIFTLELNNISSIIIENSDKRKNSLFKNIYENVFETLNKEINNIEQPHSTEECPNNIFAFIGERGTGKTSCMRSVAQMLSEDKEKFFNDKKFEVIESTDPSFFDESKNILEIFLGRIFHKFENELKKNGIHKTDEKNKVLQNFEDVKNSLACMDKKGVCEDSSVDQLIDLSASVALQKNIHDLINSYLKYVDKDFLVIPIDDIDLHTTHAYEMAEQLRKYLIQPKTIILMALKIEQMERVIERHYLNLYQSMLEKNLIQISDISDMARRYLIKLIPQSHQFPLKSIEEVLSDPVKITLNGEKQQFKDRILKYIITELIFEKTRFLFYNLTKETSPIIPRNLRECTYLLDFLIHMDTSEKDAPLRKYNQKKFIVYFLNNWSRVLKSEDQENIRDLYNNSNASHLNKAIVNILKNKLALIKGGQPDCDDDDLFPTYINQITNINNNPYNISTGDVIAFLTYYESKIFSKEDRLFLFAIKTLYSMKLYDFYNEKTDTINNEAPKANFKDKVTPILNKRDTIPNYDILVGGSFFSESDLWIKRHFKNSQYECERETRRIISILDLRNLFNKSINKKGNIIDIDTFNTIEFYALTISRPYNFEKDKIYRTSIDPTYNDEFTNQNHYVWFDIFSIFFNITRVKESYDRIDKRLYEAAAKSNKSLFKQIKKECFTEKPYCKNDIHAYLSCSSIRNYDVLEKIRYNLINECPNGENGIETIKNILTVCSNFNIKTYDSKYNNEKEPYEINFKFANVLLKFLKRIQQSDNSAFGKIYTDITDITKKNIDDITLLSAMKAFENNSTKPTLQQKGEYIQQTTFAIMLLKINHAYVENIFKNIFKDPALFEDKGSLNFIYAYSEFFKKIKTLPIIV